MEVYKNGFLLIRADCFKALLPTALAVVGAY